MFGIFFRRPIVYDYYNNNLLKINFQYIYFIKKKYLINIPKNNFPNI